MIVSPQIKDPLFVEIDLPKNVGGKFYCGDNAVVMSWLASNGKLRDKVDLIYTDPPYATNNIFKIDDTRANTISCNGRVAYTDTLTGDGFLRFMRERLALMRELMAPHASLYLHCDDKIAYDIKVIMDEVFGKKRFQAAIARIKCNPKNFTRRGFGNIKDTVLFYTKSADFVWRGARSPLSDEELTRRFPKVTESGRRYTTTPLHAPGETKFGATGKMWRGMPPPTGRHWRYPPDELERLEHSGIIEWSRTGVPRKMLYADDVAEKGKMLQDIWYFKDPQYPRYPTEKNADMLAMIIQASSEEEALVMDCFAGSGGTLQAAKDNNRRWLGVDNSPVAADIIHQRFFAPVDKKK